MERVKNLWNSGRHYLEKGLWESDGSSSLLGRFLKQLVRIGVVVYRKFIDDSCLLRASALTYATLLAIVPLLALMFSVLKGFGVQGALEGIILQKITVGSEQVVHQIVDYINNTNVAHLGAAGLVALLLTVVAMLTNIEQSFNHIWVVRETRTWVRRFSDYLSVLVLGPIFLFAAISMTTTLQSHAFLQHLMGMAYVGQVILTLFKVLPYVVMWAAFIFLYIFMPNVKVHFSAALVGGIVGGSLWQLAQWGYVYAQVGVARYNAIYGTMAALPILMVWIYTSWLIVLMGVVLTYVVQNINSIRREIAERQVGFLDREKAALAMMAVIIRGFYQQETWTPGRLAAHLGLPPRLRQEVLEELIRLDFVVAGVDEDGEEGHLTPGRPPETTTVADLLQAFRNRGEELPRRAEATEWQGADRLELWLERAEKEALQGMTLKEMTLAEEEETTGEE
jgi:membrane protein